MFDKSRLLKHSLKSNLGRIPLNAAIAHLAKRPFATCSQPLLDLLLSQLLQLHIVKSSLHGDDASPAGVAAPNIRDASKIIESLPIIETRTHLRTAVNQSVGITYVVGIFAVELSVDRVERLALKTEANEAIFIEVLYDHEKNVLRKFLKGVLWINGNYNILVSSK